MQQQLGPQVNKQSVIMHEQIFKTRKAQMFRSVI